MSITPETAVRQPRLFERLAAGLKEGEAWARGERNLHVTTITVPEPPPPYDAGRIRTLRERLQVSQRDFSRLLNVSHKTVQSWEQGARLPSQASLRLLQVIETPEMLTMILPERQTETASERASVASSTSWKRTRATAGTAGHSDHSEQPASEDIPDLPDIHGVGKV